MKLKQGENYKLINPLAVRTAISIGSMPSGTEIKIQQVDKTNRQYLVDNVWMHYSTVENAIADRKE